MNQLPDEILYDVRLIERHIRKGLITRKDADARLKAIEDQTDQADFLSFDSLTKPGSAEDGKSAGESSESAS